MRIRVSVALEDTSLGSAVAKVLSTMNQVGIQVLDVRGEEITLSDSYARRPLEEWAAKLRDNPGEWIVVEELSSNDSRRARNLAYSINHGVTKNFQPKGTFEATAKQIRETGNVQVVARYVGG